MVGCSGAQINLSVKSAIRFPANDCLERDIAELQSKTWKLGQKGVAGAKSGRKAYEVVAVLHPMEPGSTAGDLIVRYLGTQGVRADPYPTFPDPPQESAVSYFRLNSHFNFSETMPLPSTRFSF